MSSSLVVHVVILGLFGFYVAQCAAECNIYDEKSVLSVTRQKYPSILAAESLDPLIGDDQKGDLVIYNYKIGYFLDTPVLKHLKNCTVENAAFDKEESSNDYLFKCPHLTITSDFTIDAVNKDEFTETQGTGKLTTGEVMIAVEIAFRLKEVTDNEHYIKLKESEIGVYPTENVTFKITSQYDSKRNITDEEIAKFNEDEQDSAQDLSVTIIAELMKMFVKKLKHYFKTNTMESIYCEK